MQARLTLEWVDDAARFWTVGVVGGDRLVGSCAPAPPAGGAATTSPDATRQPEHSDSVVPSPTPVADGAVTTVIDARPPTYSVHDLGQEVWVVSADRVGRLVRGASGRPIVWDAGLLVGLPPISDPSYPDPYVEGGVSRPLALDLEPFEPATGSPRVSRC